MTIIKHRRGTAAQWSSINPVLSAGEHGVELDTNKFKVGNGVNAWVDLPYFVNESTVNTKIATAIDELDIPDVSDGELRELVTGSPTGDLSGLNTTDTSSVVNAINEVAGATGAAPVPDADTNTKGVVLLASLAQMATGTDPSRVATVAGVRQERLALRDEILGGVGPMADTLQELYALAQAAEETQAINDLITVVNGKASQADLTALTSTVNAKPSQTDVDAKADKPIAGVTFVQQFVYTNPTVTRPAVPAYVSLNWVGPAGSGGAAPTNMATNDTWDVQV